MVAGNAVAAPHAVVADSRGDFFSTLLGVHQDAVADRNGDCLLATEGREVPKLWRKIVILHPPYAVCCFRQDPVAPGLRMSVGHNFDGACASVLPQLARLVTIESSGIPEMHVVKADHHTRSQLVLGLAATEDELTARHNDVQA